MPCEVERALQARSVVTRFSDIGKAGAIGVLVVLVAAMVLMVLVSLHTTMPVGATDADSGDLALYRKIIEQMRAGSNYYVAAHDQLVANGYGTLSVFNWRTPLLPWLVGLFPSLALAQVVLMVLAAVAGAAMGRLMYTIGGWRLAGPALALMTISLAGCFVPQTILFSDIPAGVLIMLSAALYGLNRRGWGLAAGAVALFVRELAGLYVLVCMYLAWREKRYRELAGWCAVLCVYGLYFASHYYNVQINIQPGDPGYSEGWLQLGGASFVLKTAAFNGFFMLWPLWVNALVLPMAVLGLFAWPLRTGAHAALAVVAYAILFALVGKAFNDYWGALYTPLMTLGLAWFPFALADLLRAIGAKREIAVQVP